MNSPWLRELGYSGDSIYIYPWLRGQVVRLSVDRINEATLVPLAPLDYWESTYPGRKGGCDWRAAREAILRGAEAVGVYDPTRIRGRGVWRDTVHGYIANLGSRLITSRGAVDWDDTICGGIYVKGVTLPVNTNAAELLPLERDNITKIFGLLRTDQPIQQAMLMGWCLLAPLCGALQWRPHIHLTGAAGTGKSWLLANVITPLLGPWALHRTGATSEASLRNDLQTDALPCVLDEFEMSGSQGNQQRVESIYELIRQSSSETGASIAKGSAGGGQATHYKIRSMFCLASIKNAATRRSDTSRITPIELRRNSAEFVSLRRQVIETINPQHCDGLRVWALSNMPAIVAAVDTFREAAAVVCGDRRDGDQIGTLLAGAYCMEHGTGCTQADAEAYLYRFFARPKPTAAPVEITDADAIECRLLLLQTLIDVDVYRITIAECVAKILDHDFSTAYTQALERYGIICVDAGMFIARQHKQLLHVYRGTDYERGWYPYLMRLPGAMRRTMAIHGEQVAGVWIAHNKKLKQEETW